MRSVKKSFFIILLLVFSIGCLNNPGSKEFAEIEKIPSANEQERIDKFNSYPIDKQIDVFLFSQCCNEGGGFYYNKYIAQNGQTKIDRIANRIDISNHPMQKAHLISVLLYINEICRCVNENSEVIAILEKNEMHVDDTDSYGIATFKKLYYKDLQAIKSFK